MRPPSPCSPGARRSGTCSAARKTVAPAFVHTEIRTRAERARPLPTGGLPSRTKGLRRGPDRPCPRIPRIGEGVRRAPGIPEGRGSGKDDMVDHRPVVVGVDGSAWSLRAVDRAVDAAVRYDVGLRIVHAFREERHAGLVSGRLSVELPGSLAGVAVERACRRAPRLEVTTHLVPHSPADALAAESRKARMMVVGHRGRGRLASSLLGSVGLNVAACAHCPVVVVRGLRRTSQGATAACVWESASGGPRLRSGGVRLRRGSTPRWSHRSRTCLAVHQCGRT
ncbi:universal stress protein [Streptomyces sp. CA-132043]|uniref:universal stress protein n=1 Tax=Streptomyces sp. CA-132043 TaxID=3240048 RepID=UPI003D8A3F01